MRFHKTFPIALVLVGSVATPLLGHHSIAAEYDASKAMTIQGTITRVEWNNPHVWIYMNVTGSDGSIAAWRIEIAARGALDKAGFEKSFLDLTKSFSMLLWPAFDGTKHASGRTLTLSDGRTFDVSDKWPQTPVVSPAPN